MVVEEEEFRLVQALVVEAEAVELLFQAWVGAVEGLLLILPLPSVSQG